MSALELNCAAWKAAQVARAVYNTADHDLIITESIKNEPAFDRKGSDLRAKIGPISSDLREFPDRAAFPPDPA
jgi:hypothetical protein